jgi:Tfp pilus assembly protein PilN
MAARRKKHLINLLPQEEFASSTLGRVLTWALSTFRVIVIVTEIIVMGAFLSRFWLDARLSDLNDSLKQKQAVINATSDFEEEFRKTQKQLKIFSQVSQNKSSVGNILNEIGSFLPNDIYLTSYTFTESIVKIKGFSSSERSIAQLISNLEASDAFGEVSLNQLDTSRQQKSLLSFTLKIELGKKGGS